MAFKSWSVTDMMSIYEHIKKRKISNGNLISISAFQRCEMKSVHQHKGKGTREWTDTWINCVTRSSGICFQIVSKAFGNHVCTLLMQKHVLNTDPLLWQIGRKHLVPLITHRSHEFPHAFRASQSYTWLNHSYCLLTFWVNGCLIFWFIREWKVRKKMTKLRISVAPPGT